MNNKSKSRPDKEASGKSECKQYELDLTDYVMGDMTFLTKEKQEKLFEHLRKCAKCREEFFDWEKTYGVMVTKQHHATPEAKKRYAELLAKIKELPDQPKDRPIDDELVLGTAADQIYRVLKGNGKIAYPVLRVKARLKGEPFYESIGWLAKEKKIRRTRDEQTVYVSLTEREREQKQA